MIKLVLALIALLLSGCASDGGGSYGAQVDTTTRSQAIAKIHTELADSYFGRKQYGVALQEIDTALRAESRYAPAFNMRGLIRMELLENDRADEDFKRSLQLDPRDSRTHNNYGWFLCNSGHEKKSIPQFIEALNNPLYSTPEKALANAGVCSKKLGNLKEAKVYFLRALVRQPNLPEALYGLAELSFAEQDFIGAKSYFLKYQEKLLELTAESLWLAVRIEREVKDANSEKSYALQLRKHFPDSRETQLLLKGE
ncbi:MAG: type IV pilus biogenesis/stability protein PilW [Gallionellaceae bacterium]